MTNTSATYEEKKAWFEDYFLTDLDKWFSADMACCDLCYDEFLRYWPHAYSAGNEEFQKSSIDLGVFYSESRLREIYSKDEFDEFIQDIMCPRCDSPLKANIWPYNLPFDGAEAFEKDMEEIANVASETPFLLLKNSFASSVLNDLLAIADQTQAMRFGQSLFRAITFKSAAEAIESDFDFPPRGVVKEGRYNHAGSPVLYLGNSAETCWHEIRSTEGTVAQVNVSVPLKTLDFVDAFRAHKNHSTLLDLLVYSALLSAKHDSDCWHKPEYVFSRFVADCAKSAGFDAIRYPSTRRGIESFNLVILNRDINLQNNQISISNISPLEF